MKTAISIPDRVFQEAERLARRLSKSPNEVFEEALAEYVARHDPDALTEAADRVAAQVDTRPDDFISTATRRVLERNQW